MSEIGELPVPQQENLLSVEDLQRATTELRSLFFEKLENSAFKERGLTLVPIGELDEYRRGLADPAQKKEPTNYLYLKNDQPNWEIDWSEEDRLNISRWTPKSAGFYGRHRFVDQENPEGLIIRTGQNPSIEYTFKPKDNSGQESQRVSLQNTPSVVNKAREIIGSIPQAQK